MLKRLMIDGLPASALALAYCCVRRFMRTRSFSPCSLQNIQCFSSKTCLCSPSFYMPMLFSLSALRDECRGISAYGQKGYTTVSISATNDPSNWRAVSHGLCEEGPKTNSCPLYASHMSILVETPVHTSPLVLHTVINTTISVYS